jgi:hypothetical protein
VLKLKRHILAALLKMDGNPMPEESLLAAARLLGRPDHPTDGDLGIALKLLESDGYVAGVTDDLAGRSWTLTTKGTHKARQL